jgi:hypothetical protein
MEALLLQDYCTIRGTPATRVVQPAYGWLDLGDLEDVVLYLDVRETIPHALLQYETAPAANDSAFVPLIPQFIMSAGLRTDIALASMAKVPPGRFLRWNISGDGFPAWDVTFRIWVAGYGWA